MSKDENALFGESVDYNQDRIETIRSQKWLNEVHGNGIPRMQRNWKLLEGAIRLVKLRLGLHTSCARPAVIPYVTLETWPVKLMSDKSEGFVLS